MFKVESDAEFDLVAEEVATITRDDIEIGLNNVQCLDMDTCKIVGGGQYVYTGPGESGLSWDNEEAGSVVSSFWGVYYSDEEHGWVTGQNSIRHLEDGEWVSDEANIGGEVVSFIPVNMVRDVTFVGGIGYIVGDDGLILKYTPDCEEIEEVECAEGETRLEFYEDGCVVEYACVEVISDDEEGCPEVEELECDEGDTLIEYTDDDECIIGYLCQINPEPYVLVYVDEDEEETCQEQYRECLEEYPYNSAYCDGTYEFCDDIDEVLEDFLNSNEQRDAVIDIVEQSFKGASSFEFLLEKYTNVYITREDGTEMVLGITVEDGVYTVVEEALDDASVTVYLTEDAINAFSESDDLGATLKEAMADESVKVETKGLKSKLKFVLVKVYLFFS